MLYRRPGSFGCQFPVMVRFNPRLSNYELYSFPVSFLKAAITSLENSSRSFRYNSSNFGACSNIKCASFPALSDEDDGLEIPSRVNI